MQQDLFVLQCAMLVRWLCLAGLIILSVANAGSAAGPSSGDVFTSSFLVRFKRNIDRTTAHEIANKYGYDNLGTVSKRNFLKLYSEIFIDQAHKLVDFKFNFSLSLSGDWKLLFINRNCHYAAH